MPWGDRGMTGGRCGRLRSEDAPGWTVNLTFLLREMFAPVCAKCLVSVMLRPLFMSYS